MTPQEIKDLRELEQWNRKFYPTHETLEKAWAALPDLLDEAENFAKGCVTCTYGHEQFNMLSETALAWHNEGQAFQEQLRVLADENAELQERHEETLDALQEAAEKLEGHDDGRGFAG